MASDPIPADGSGEGRGTASDALRRRRPRDPAVDTTTVETAAAEPVTEPVPPVAAEPPEPSYDGVTDAPAPATAVEEPAPAREPWRLAIPLMSLLAALLALAVTLATLSASDHRAVREARTDALAAAKKAATAILSASYRTVDNDIAAARKTLTPRFQGEYDKIAKGAFRQQVVDNQGIITAQVQAAGVKQASRDRVVVLLFVNQLSTNNKRPVPRLDQPRVRMTLVLRDGKWLVDRMDAI